MADISDGIGTMIEGTMLARTTSHDTALPGAHAAAGPVACPNCCTVFTGNFCPECGQKAHLHRSLAAIGHDLLHAVLHLDGKLSHTLPLLIAKPGDLTRRFIAGERAKFVSPMSMFLFTVFAMFAVFQMVGVTAPTDFADGMIEGFTDDSPFQRNIQRQITTLEQERSALPAGSPRRTEIDSEVKTLNKILAEAKPEATSEKSTANADPTESWIESHVFEKWKKNPGLMIYKLQSNGYKFSWLLIPLSIPFLWLMFAWRPQFKAYDHAVFVTYSLSFMSLLFIVMSILSTVPGSMGWVIALFGIAAPLHLYKQLRYAYSLSRFSALWRFAVLLFSTQVVMMLFLLILGLLGAF